MGKPRKTLHPAWVGVRESFPEKEMPKLSLEAFNRKSGVGRENAFQTRPEVCEIELKQRIQLELGVGPV